jgi:hypothetical protein
MSVRSQCLHAISSEPQGTMIAPVAFWMTLSVNAVKRTALCRICFSCLIPTTSASPPLGLPLLFINPQLFHSHESFEIWFPASWAPWVRYFLPPFWVGKLQVSLVGLMDFMCRITFILFGFVIGRYDLPEWVLMKDRSDYLISAILLGLLEKLLDTFRKETSLYHDTITYLYWAKRRSSDTIDFFFSFFCRSKA